MVVPFDSSPDLNALEASVPQQDAPHQLAPKDSALAHKQQYHSANSDDDKHHAKAHRILHVHLRNLQGMEAAGLFLRLSVLAFGVGVLVFDGIKIGSNIANWLYCELAPSALVFIKDCCHILFILCQMWFLFKHAKISFVRKKTLVRFGLMHLLATNIVFWEETIMQEAEENLNNQTVDFHKSHSEFSDQAMDLVNATNCDQEKMLLFESLLHGASPYLYPCIVEYSLVSAAIVYILYANVGHLSTHTKLAVFATAGVEMVHQKHLRQRTSFRVDCIKSTKGLFLGLILVVGVVVSIIMFHMYYSKSSKAKENAESHTSFDIFIHTELVLLLISSAALINGLHQMKKLSFRLEKLKGPDSILLFVACIAVYIFEVFNFVEACYEETLIKRAVRGCKAILSTIEVTLQIFFILDGMRRVTKTTEQERMKPGRETMTLLLMINIALWLTHTFETRIIYSDFRMLDFYTPLPWSIIISICAPLLIFYRFHSTICLTDIWKHAYAPKKNES